MVEEYIHCYIGKNPLHIDAICAAASFPRRFDSTNAALAFIKDQLPHVIYLDINQYGREGLRFLASLRQELPAASPPVMILQSAENIPGNFEAALFRQSECYVLKPNEIATRLTSYVNMLLDQHYRERDEAIVHPHALELVSGIWRRGSSGKLTSQVGEVALQNGGVVAAGALGLIKQMLHHGGVAFESAPNSGYGDWLGVGSVLYEAALKRTKPGFLRDRKNLAFISTPGERGLDLPLSAEMQTLMRVGDPKDSIQNRIVQAELRLSQVEAEIEALTLLGCCIFTKSENSKSAFSGNTMDVGSELERVADWESRLAAECPWKTIGIKATANPIVFEQAAQQELQRLMDAAKTNRIGEIKRLAHALAQRVDSLRPVLQELVALYRFFGLPKTVNSQEESAFIQAYMLLDSGFARNAYRLFCVSLEENPGSIRNQLYCAWAAFLVDPTQGPQRLNEIQIAAAGRPGYFPASRFVSAIYWRMQNKKASVLCLKQLAADSDERSEVLLRRLKRSPEFPLSHLHRH